MRGVQSGVGVSVSGAGAWARLTGQMTFSIRHLEKSQTYEKLKTSSGFEAGVGAFWGWLGIGVNVEQHRDEIHQVFNEIQDSQEVDGKARFKLMVTGQYPNVRVDAAAYVLVLQVEDSSGNSYRMMSAGDPSTDTGAQDQNGNTLPTKNNDSTIEL
jgi:hypothetical protein